MFLCGQCDKVKDSKTLWRKYKFSSNFGGRVLDFLTNMFSLVLYRKWVGGLWLETSESPNTISINVLSIFLGTHLSNLCYIIHLDLVCEKRFVVNILRTFESTLKTLDTKFKCLRIDSECFLFICLVEDFKYPTGSDSGCIMTKPPGLGWV